jgi:HEAT repeat protein
VQVTEDFRRRFAGMSVAELFELAAREVEDPPPERDGPDFYWGPIQELHAIGTREVFETAAALVRRGAATERAAAALVLGQLGGGAKPFHEERVELAVMLATGDSDARVLEATAFALGHLADERGRESLLQLHRHPSPDVRFAVAGGIAQCIHTGPEGDEDDPEVVDALIRLSRDPDPEVRNWATFGLGRQLEVDGPVIREALAERLVDPYDEVRAEAIAGLALRHDERALHPALELLRTAEEVPSGLLDALAEVDDPQFNEELRAWK